MAIVNHWQNISDPAQPTYITTRLLVTGGWLVQQEIVQIGTETLQQIASWFVPDAGHAWAPAGTHWENITDPLQPTYITTRLNVPGGWLVQQQIVQIGTEVLKQISFWFLVDAGHAWVP